MKEHGTIELFRYWNRLRGDRPAPKRSEVEPADIKTLLSETFILERDVRGEAIFRLAGTRLCSIHGRELKGFAFASLWRMRDQRLIAKFVENSFAQGAVGVVGYRGISQGGRSCGFEMLLLPLDGGERHQRCLGIMSATEKPGWLTADPIVENATDSVRAVDPEREPLFLGNRPAMAVPSLAPSDAEVTALPWRRVRHLAVLEGGRSAVD